VAVAHPTFDIVNAPDRFPNFNISGDHSIWDFGLLVPGCLTSFDKMFEGTREPHNDGLPPLELSGTSRKRVSPDATDDASLCWIFR
jgi:hypothetical protein